MCQNPPAELPARGFFNAKNFKLFAQLERGFTVK